MLEDTGGPFLRGARGVRCAGLSLMAGKDKLVLAVEGSPVHYTLHFGTRSGTLDLHETRETGDPADRYRTLYTIPRANLDALWEDIGPVAVRALFGSVRRLKPGWMARRRIGAVFGLVEQDDLDAVTVVRKRKLEVDPQLLAARVRSPEYLAELYDLPDGGAFSLVDWSRSPRLIGTGFKISDPRPRLIWLSFRRLSRALRELEPVALEAAARYGSVAEAGHSTARSVEPHWDGPHGK